MLSHQWLSENQHRTYVFFDKLNWEFMMKMTAKESILTLYNSTMEQLTRRSTDMQIKPARVTHLKNVTTTLRNHFPA